MTIVTTGCAWSSSIWTLLRTARCRLSDAAQHPQRTLSAGDGQPGAWPVAAQVQARGGDACSAQGGAAEQRARQEADADFGGAVDTMAEEVLQLQVI